MRYAAALVEEEQRTVDAADEQLVLARTESVAGHVRRQRNRVQRKPLQCSATHFIHGVLNRHLSLPRNFLLHTMQNIRMGLAEYHAQGIVFRLVMAQ